jgi:hypothetical protein
MHKMGYNTVVMFLNDRIHDAVKDSNLGERLNRAFHGLNYPYRDDSLYRHETDFGYGKVISQAHADDDQVTVTGGNFGFNINDKRFDKHLSPWALEQMKQCLERNGFKVTKQRKKKD